MTVRDPDDHLAHMASKMGRGVYGPGEGQGTGLGVVVVQYDSTMARWNDPALPECCGDKAYVDAPEESLLAGWTKRAPTRQHERRSRVRDS